MSRLSTALVASAALVLGGLVAASPAMAVATSQMDGVVLSSNQVGLSGVTVTLEEPVTGASTGLTATTDAFGNWSIPSTPLGDYVVHYTGPFDGYADNLATLDTATTYTVADFGGFVYDVISSVTVPPNYQVSVRGSDGAVLDLCPRFYPADNPDAGPYGDTCTTTDGVTTGIIGPGSYLVEFLDFSGAYAGVWVGADGTRATATPVTFTTTGVTDIGTVTLPVAAHITVRLRAGDTGGTVPGLSCVVAFVGRTDTFGNNGCADSAGLVTIDGLRAGTYSLHTNVDSLDYVDRWSGGSRTQSGATLVTVKGGQTVTAPTITVPRGATITGTIRDKTTGLPVQGICASTGRFSPVGQEDGTRQLLDSCSDADGHYRIRGLDDVAVKIQFVTAGYQAPATGYAIAWYGGSNHDEATPVKVPLGKTRRGIDVALSPEGTLSGTAVDASGGPIPDFIYADDFSTGYPISYGEDYPGTSFSMGHLPTGTVLLRWSTPSGQRFWDGTPYGTADRSRAKPIRTKAGQAVTGIQIRVR